MPMPDPLLAIARDLRSVAAADRRAILGALDAEERARVMLAMRGVTPSPPPTRGERLYSPWVERLIADAEAGADRLAPSARVALLDATGTVAAPGRTLLQAAGGLLGRAMAR